MALVGPSDLEAGPRTRQLDGNRVESLGQGWSGRGTGVEDHDLGLDAAYRALVHEHDIKARGPPGRRCCIAAADAHGNLRREREEGAALARWAGSDSAHGECGVQLARIHWRCRRVGGEWNQVLDTPDEVAADRELAQPEAALVRRKHRAWPVEKRIWLLDRDPDTDLERGQRPHRREL